MSTRSTDFLLFIFAFLSRVNKHELGLYEKGLNSPHSLYKLQTFLKTNLLWSTVALQCCVSFCCTPQRISYIYTLILDSLYSSATPSFPSQPEGKIGLPRANPRGRLRSPSSRGRRGRGTWFTWPDSVAQRNTHTPAGG